MKLGPGQDAPDFELRDASGKLWKLADLRGKKVVLYFYPADDTPGCTAEACDFRDTRDEFEAAGYIVLGVSPQNARSHQAFTNKYALNFPLLIDHDLEVARSYGSLPERSGKYKGIPLEIARSTFVIDEKGRIRHALYGVRARNHVAGLKDLLSL
jgi:peroxiredoxin Q/BCP